jgi:hypothetical protein
MRARRRGLSPARDHASVDAPGDLELTSLSSASRISGRDFDVRRQRSARSDLKTSWRRVLRDSNMTANLL